MSHRYQLDTGYACGLIVLDDRNKIIDAAPIFRWMVGKKWEWVRRESWKTKRLMSNAATDTEAK